MHPLGIFTIPRLVTYDVVGLRKKNGSLGTAFPNSLACSEKLRPMATIFRPARTKFAISWEFGRIVDHIYVYMEILLMTDLLLALFLKEIESSPAGAAEMPYQMYGRGEVNSSTY